MVSRNAVRIVIVALVVVLAGAPATLAKDPLTGVSLQWTPTTPLSDYGVIDLSRVSHAKVRVMPFTSKIEKPELIGENREKDDEGKILPVTTKDKVAKFCTQNVEQIFDQVGLQVAESDATVVVTGEVKRFFVTETHTYDGEVSIRIEVRDLAGKSLWTGVTSGSARRFGRSYQLGNYLEVLSDSLLTATVKLLRNDGFLDALHGK